MAPGKVDSAILEALHLDPDKTTISSHGGAGFASSSKIVSEDENGREQLFFVKTAHGKGAAEMLEGEHESLNAIHRVVPSLCPRSHAHGRLSTGDASFMVTDFLDMRMLHGRPGSGEPLAAKLATLHSTPAPVPPGFSQPQFGFRVPTCCGATQQPNDFCASWADFFARNRLRAIMRAVEAANGPDADLRAMVERTADKVVPRLLGKLNGGRGPTPVVVHGDLWSGNHGRGSIGAGGVEEVVFDPSSAYAHSEFELGIMKMFGGFSSTFYKEYYKLKPKDDPAEEHEDRVLLYEL